MEEFNVGDLQKLSTTNSAKQSVSINVVSINSVIHNFEKRLEHTIKKYDVSPAIKHTVIDVNMSVPELKLDTQKSQYNSDTGV